MSYLYLFCVTYDAGMWTQPTTSWWSPMWSRMCLQVKTRFDWCLCAWHCSCMMLFTASLETSAACCFSWSCVCLPWCIACLMCDVQTVTWSWQLMMLCASTSSSSTGNNITNLSNLSVGWRFNSFCLVSSLACVCASKFLALCDDNAILRWSGCTGME